MFLMQDSKQIKLLKELMDLQKDMVVFLLSMLEGKSVRASQVIKNIFVLYRMFKKLMSLIFSWFILPSSNCVAGLVIKVHAYFCLLIGIIFNTCS